MLKKPHVKNWLRTSLKLSFTIVVCLFLVLHGNWSAIGHALREANPLLLLIVLLSMFFCVTISAAKWQLLLSIHDISFSLGVLHRYYLVALFFNNFLPSNIGGDIYRIYKTLSNQKSRACAIIAVFLERLTGMWALLFLGWVGGMVLILRQTDMVPFIKPATLFFAAGVVLPVGAGVFLVWYGGKTTIASRIPSKARLVLDRISDFRRQRIKVIQILCISFFFHIFSLGWMTLLLQAIGTDFSFYKLAVTVAVSNLVAILPFSINGIGLMDGSFVYVATAFGMDYNYALTFLLLMRGTTLAISLIGGFLYVKERRQVDMEDLQRESMKIKESTL